MKKILLLGTICMLFSKLMAQENIEIRIEPIFQNEQQILKVKIINYNPELIILSLTDSCLATTPPTSHGYSSYIQLIGNPFTTGNGIDTGPNKQRPRVGGMLLPTNVLSQPITLANSIHADHEEENKIRIEAGANREISFPVFGDPSHSFIFPLPEGDQIRSVQLKAVLSYYYEGDKKEYKHEFMSNIISYDELIPTDY